jgi:hypothetical protein
MKQTNENNKKKTHIPCHYLYVELLYDPTIPPLGVYTGEMNTCVHKNTQKRIFMPSLIIITKR